MSDLLMIWLIFVSIMFFVFAFILIVHLSEPWIRHYEDRYERWVNKKLYEKDKELE